jgi:enoyl-CoA hydratase/carnithine racemase
MTKSTTDAPRLLIEARGPVEWVTLNRPDALNALNPGMIEDLRDYFLGLPDRRDVRIVVLRGAGRAFCAGLDLKNESSANDTASGGGVQRGLKTQRRIAEIVMAMRRFLVSSSRGSAAPPPGRPVMPPAAPLPPERPPPGRLTPPPPPPPPGRPPP